MTDPSDELHTIKHKTPAPPLISNKRYTVTFEGVGSADGSLAVLTNGIDYISPNMLRMASTIEPLPDPLPTTPGSVVRWKQWSGELRTLSRETGRLPWRDVNSPHLCFSDEELRDVTVLFDLGD